MTDSDWCGYVRFNDTIYIACEPIGSSLEDYVNVVVDANPTKADAIIGELLDLPNNQIKYKGNTYNAHGEVIHHENTFVITYKEEFKLKLNSLVMPMTRRIFPQTVARQLVTVQPMTGPISCAYTLKHKYGDK